MQSSFDSLNISPKISKKAGSFQDISAKIAMMFVDPGEKVETFEIHSAKQVEKEVENIVAKFKPTMEWDDVLTLVQTTMSLVKSGAGNYQQFISELSKFIPLLTFCVTNLRSTLVKFGCLCISLMAQELNEAMDSIVETLIQTLFQPTSHGTAIISQSCKCALQSIAQNVPTKKVLNTIISMANSKNSEYRIIVAESIFVISQEWPKSLLTQNSKQIHSILDQLSSDANATTRKKAKDAKEGLSNRLSVKPNKSPIPYKGPSAKQMIDQLKRKLDVSQTMIIPSTKYENETEISEISATPTKVNSQLDSSFVKFEEGSEKAFLDSLKKIKSDKNMIEKYKTDIADGLVRCLQSATTPELISVMNNINSLLPIISSSFEPFLKILLKYIMDLTGTSLEFSSMSLLKNLPNYFDHKTLLHLALENPPSFHLLSFSSSIIRDDQNVLRDDSICDALIPICCYPYNGQYETRARTMIERILLKISLVSPHSIQKYAATANKEALDILYDLKCLPKPPKLVPETPRISPRTEVIQTPLETVLRPSSFQTPQTERIPVSTLSLDKKFNTKRSKPLNEILSNLNTSDDKDDCINELSNYFFVQKEFDTNCLIVLSELLRSEYFEAAEASVDVLCQSVDESSLLKSVLESNGKLTNAGNLDLLRLTIRGCCETTVTNSRFAFMKILSAASIDRSAEVRKSAIMAIVEAKKKIGPALNSEISKLGPVQQGLVEKYIMKS